jgi:hypothetical protein
VRGQESGVRSQRSEVRNQRSEVREALHKNLTPRPPCLKGRGREGLQYPKLLDTFPFGAGQRGRIMDRFFVPIALYLWRSWLDRYKMSASHPRAVMRRPSARSFERLLSEAIALNFSLNPRLNTDEPWIAERRVRSQGARGTSASDSSAPAIRANPCPSVVSVPGQFWPGA